jgi:signal transduction histidine kinase
LQFHVEDILGLAQIKSGKFSKNSSVFEVKKAIEEIVKIQEQAAN